jgi:hypothetical protein
MEIALNSRARRMWLLAPAVLIGGIFLASSTRQFAADYLSNSAQHLDLAVRLAPGNARYHALLGTQLLQARTDLPAALEQYRLAIALNPHDASYWLALADGQQILNDIPGQRYALERAVEADPTTPDLAWVAANFFLAQGDTAMALREFRVVVENEPGMAYAALGLSSHVADVAAIVKNVLPPEPRAYLTLIDFLTSQKDTAGAVQVWNALAQLGKSFEPRYALAYIDYLISQHEIADARLAWRQAAQLCGLSAYLASRENLIVNSHFDSVILNGGFDWRYRRQANVEVALDPAEFHGGHRSLSVIFDGPGVNEAGIAQYVPVQPDTVYEFSAYYKADAMDGAGGPRLSIQDAYRETDYFSSDDLQEADVWRELHGEFKTSADAQLVIVRILRMPMGSPIRGKLWLDDFRLAEKDIGL